MKNIEKIKGLINNNKKLLEKKYSVKTIGIFGSSIKGELTKESDIDIIVDFYESPDLFKFINLEEFLKHLVHRKVDLVSKKALKPLIKDEILREAVYI